MCAAGPEPMTGEIRSGTCERTVQWDVKGYLLTTLVCTILEDELTLVGAVNGLERTEADGEDF